MIPSHLLAGTGSPLGHGPEGEHRDNPGSHCGKCCTTQSDNPGHGRAPFCALQVGDGIADQASTGAREDNGQQGHQARPRRGGGRRDTGAGDFGEAPGHRLEG